MSEINNSIDGIRGGALERIERNERHFKQAFFGAVLIEAFFLLGYLLLADFSDRMHVLLLVATIAIYTIIALGLVALGSYINRNTLRVLKAVELLASQIRQERD